MPYARKTASEITRTKEVHVTLQETIGGWLPVVGWFNTGCSDDGEGFWDIKGSYPYSFENKVKALKAADEWARDEDIPMCILEPHLGATPTD